MRESTIRTTILRFLNSLPNSYFQVSPPGTPTGTADITGCLDGRYVAVEVKVPGKEPTAAQRYWLRKMRDAGAIVFVAHSVSEAVAQLNAALREKRAA